MSQRGRRPTSKKTVDGAGKRAQPKNGVGKERKVRGKGFGGPGSIIYEGSHGVVLPMERKVTAAGLKSLSMEAPRQVEAKAAKFAKWFNSGKGFELEHAGHSKSRDVSIKEKKKILLAQFYRAVEINDAEARRQFIRKFMDALEPDLRRVFYEMIKSMPL
jgi:hypothetical protein